MDGAENVQVVTTASLDAVSLAGVAALAHVDEAWAATVKQCTIGAALRIELRNANSELKRLQRTRLREDVPCLHRWDEAVPVS